MTNFKREFLKAPSECLSFAARTWVREHWDDNPTKDQLVQALPHLAKHQVAIELINWVIKHGVFQNDQNSTSPTPDAGNGGTENATESSSSTDQPDQPTD